LNVSPVERIRARFPALARREAGWPVAYFDGPGGTQVPEHVARAVADYLLHHNANTHWAYATSVETDLLIADAREAFADLFGCTPLEVAFGANMTTLTFHVARALGRRWGPDDEIVVTRLDHQANVAPWTALAQERGVCVREVPFDPRSGTLDLEAFAAALGSRTRLVAIGGASNALGTVNDVQALAARARSVGALTFVDAVHLVPHELPDVRAFDCDLLACSPYKFYGPHLGVLFVRRDLLEDLDAPRLACAPAEAPERLETGTLSHEGIVGAAAAVDFLASLARPEPREKQDRRSHLVATYRELGRRGEALVERLWLGLDDVRGVRLYGPAPGRHPRTPTVAFTVKGHPSEKVARHLSLSAGVYASHGDFYASTVIEDLGLADEGLVRAGAACYTTDEEVDRLVRYVAELARS
jgi:cysteine desulfurase family protein (TIGR01976 family)